MAPVLRLAAKKAPLVVARTQEAGTCLFRTTKLSPPARAASARLAHS